MVEYNNVDPRRLHLAIDARARLSSELSLSFDEEATLGAVDIVQATVQLGGDLADALMLVRRMWSVRREAP